MVAAYEWDDDAVQGVLSNINLGKMNDNTGEEVRERMGMRRRGY